MIELGGVTGDLLLLLELDGELDEDEGVFVEEVLAPGDGLTD